MNCSGIRRVVQTEFDDPIDWDPRQDFDRDRGQAVGVPSADAQMQKLAPEMKQNFCLDSRIIRVCEIFCVTVFDVFRHFQQI